MPSSGVPAATASSTAVRLAALAHKGDRVIERAHARDDQAVGVADLLRIVRRAGGGTGARKPAHDARQVALVVVDHHDLRFAHATLHFSSSKTTAKGTGTFVVVLPL